MPALATPSQAASGDSKVTFTVALLNDVDSFNPFKGYLAEAYEMWALTYDYMTGYKMTDMSPEPALAKSWDTSDDGLTWTFHIREGVTWSDGQPLTAKDIAYTYNRVLTGTTEAGNWGSYLKAVDKVTAPDDKTVVLQLSKPNATLPLLPIPIVPEHIWKNVSEDEVKNYPADTSDGPVVGSGPFRLVEGKAGGSTYRFEANPDYWGGKPHVDEVVFRVFKSSDPAVQALIKGEVDFVEGIKPLQVKALQGQQGITAQNGVSPLYEEIGFNTGAVDVKTGKPMGDGNPALQDPKFRHALGYALDRDRIVKTAFQGGGVVGDTIIPGFYDKWHWDVPADQAFSFDLDKAGQLLDEAGYKKGADGLRTMPDGSPIGTLRLYARSEAKESVDTMDFFKEWLGELGIKAEVTAYESNRLGEIILDGNYDAFQWDWYVEPDPDSALSVLTCDQRGALSDSWYCNKEYDKLFAAQGVETDQTKRVAMVKKMQEILFEEAPYLVLTYTTQGEAIRSDRFACLQPQPDPGGVWLIQYGGHNYRTVRPADQAGDCDGVTSAVGATLSSSSSSSSSDSGGNNVVLVVGGIVVLLLLGAGGFFAMRRRATASDRE